MLSRRLHRALPSRRVRVTLAAIAYLAFAVTIISSTLHRDATDTREQQAESAQYYGKSAMYQLDFKTAESHFRTSIDLISGCDGDRDGSTWSADAHADLADAIAAQGRLHDAEVAYRKALRLYERADGAQTEYYVGALAALADLHTAAGRDSASRACTARIAEIRARRVATAESEFTNFRAEVKRRITARREVNTLELANRLIALGRLHYEQGDSERAEVEFVEAYELRLAALGPFNHRTVAARDNLGQARAANGKFAQARVDLLAALANYERAHGRDGTFFLEELTTLGNIGMKFSDYAAADSCYFRVFENLEKRVGQDHWYLVPALEKLAACRLEMGQFAVARGLRERIRRIHTKALGAESYAVGVDLLELAEIEDRAGRSGWARARCSAALRTLTAAVGLRHPTAVEARIYLSELWEDAARPVDDARVPRNVVGGETPTPGSEPSEEELEDSVA